MSGFLESIIDPLSTKLPELFVGLVVGVSVVLLIRAGHVWRDRKYYGYSVYEADRIQRWLYFWAIRAGLLAMIGGMVYWWSDVSSISPPDTLALTTQPTPTPSTPARLVIPRIGVNALLIDVPLAGWKWDTARMTFEVGHLEGTPELGGPGNAVLAGHVIDLAGVPGPFWELASIQPGDYVYLEHGSAIFKYEVAEIRRVDPQDVWILYQPAYQTQLTLLTCDDFDAATETYQKRLIVIARRVHS